MASSREHPVVLRCDVSHLSHCIGHSIRRWFHRPHCKQLVLVIICVLFLWYAVLIHSHYIAATITYVSGLRDLSNFAAPRLLWKFGIAVLCDKHDDIEYVLTNNRG